ncbi:hypothetical protein K493DRAFT_346001 [Basidiobolus meristosporus CBS 931.73]|uniref:Uncharacterized protein n=1 Tax=Basidiobolus meristosporus CBS 931.73 TaxID=1314790 RepID=A0A1Y1Z0R8_9FUNG|nr:hypothetical protein K493DRAFT_346001 [Basidiobolus meristosporus CBS 931.73]|eukprot:ORY03714.1 hypothetical protein K493DRAFT_346001 [Basidiobolus meristosporus CBS 931.73]
MGSTSGIKPEYIIGFVIAIIVDLDEERRWRRHLVWKKVSIEHPRKILKGLLRLFPPTLRDLR